MMMTYGYFTVGRATSLCCSEQHPEQRVWSLLRHCTATAMSLLPHVCVCTLSYVYNPLQADLPLTAVSLCCIITI